jgi:hypothetical protein
MMETTHLLASEPSVVVCICSPNSLYRRQREEFKIVRSISTLTIHETKLRAMAKLEMGHVLRITLRLRQRFWDTIRPPS